MERSEIVIIIVLVSGLVLFACLYIKEKIHNCKLESSLQEANIDIKNLRHQIDTLSNSQYQQADNSSNDTYYEFRAFTQGFYHPNQVCPENFM